VSVSEVVEKAVASGSVKISKADLALFIDRLRKTHTVYGPRTRREQVAFGPIESAEEMDLAYTATTVLSPKKYLHRPMETLFRGKFRAGEVLEESLPTAKQALVGVHPCDVNAILLLDKVFSNKHYEDPYYQALRKNTLIIAINCTAVGENCFCASMGTGPSLEKGYDLLLTDLDDGYLVEIGTEAGGKALEGIPTRRPTEGDFQMRDRKLAATRELMPKFMDTDGLPAVLDEEFNNPYWAQLKEECLACGNCNMVCPSCFCYNVVDKLDLRLSDVERVRTWDGCLLLEFAEVHGGNFRKERDARIKQWMYHKLNYWVDQYGSLGCVGCGRCVTWCPKGIDITETMKKIRGGQEKS